ncbi:MAG: hypothetical protein J7K68_06450 [Candidatus Diapherotrites archaeon]|nr:hypothetical protein [Candidatus Diapherotrites archaeon]
MKRIKKKLRNIQWAVFIIVLSLIIFAIAVYWISGSPTTYNQTYEKPEGTIHQENKSEPQSENTTFARQETKVENATREIRCVDLITGIDSIPDAMECFGDNYLACTYYFLLKAREVQGSEYEDGYYKQQLIVAYANKAMECAQFGRYVDNRFPEDTGKTISVYLNTYQTCYENQECWKSIGTEALKDVDALIAELSGYI